jgi:Ca-activated chloride channel family protein
MRRTLLYALVLISLLGRVAAGQTSSTAGTDVPTFRSGVDLVTINAVVRDDRGHVVTDLKRSDFSVLDTGAWRPIKEFRTEEAPVSVALLFDASGSMQVASKLEEARRAARQFLAFLHPGIDELAIYAFDSGLRQLQPFAPFRADGTLERSLVGITPFGMTSLNDAIAATARDVAGRPNAHRAVIVLTDGLDNNSRLTPAEVSGIASSIDVPVYILAVVSPLDHTGTGTAVASDRPVQAGNLSDLARWTGGRFFLTSALAQSGLAARDIAEELRHQYFIAFEPASREGWHPVEVRANDRHLVVRARSGYFAGPARQVKLAQDDRED